MKPQKILIVDDNRNEVELLSKLLGDDYQLEKAYSGEEALLQLPVFRPDLILLDIVMEGMDGYEVCRWVRQDPTHRFTKILMLSGKDQAEDRVLGYEAGANDYLTKPYVKAELEAKLRTLLQLRYKEEAQSLKIFEFMANATHDYMTLIDREYRYLAVNTAYAQSQNKESSEIVGRRVVDIWGQQDFEQIIAPRLNRCFAGETLTYQNEIDIPAYGKKHFEIVMNPFWQEEEVTHVVVVTHDITRFKQGEKALIQARDRAEKLGQMKTEFIARLSHELKTPLAIILSNVSFFLDSNDPPEAQEMVEIGEEIKESGDRLLELVEGLLDFSALERERSEGRATLVSADRLVSEACERAMPAIRAKGLRLVSQLEPLSVWADPERVGKVLGQLLSNAIKFSEEGEVCLRLLDAGPVRRFEVEDQGKGIEEADLSQIFEPFTQAEPSLTREEGGAGLGLAIAKGMVDSMGGEIGVKTRPGHGSLFYFTLPSESPT